MINLNHLTIFKAEFNQRLVKKLSKKIQLYRSHSWLLDRYFTLRMNFSNYQNRQKLRKFCVIDLYAILEPAAKFKRNWFTSFKIIRLLIFGCLTCILIGEHNMKKMLLKIQCILIYQSLLKFTYKILKKKLLRNFRKINSMFFFTIKYKWHNNN